MRGQEDGAYQGPSAEDYFSDDTVGRKAQEFVKRAGLGGMCSRPRPKRRESLRAAVKELLSESELNRALDKLLPGADDRLASKAIIREAVFPRITELLQLSNKCKWSLLPRTFVILRILGCPEAMDAFIAENRSDNFLPYNEKNLPNVIKGHFRDRFIKLQNLVEFSPELTELEQEGGKHIHFVSSPDTYFKTINNLGIGKYGEVDRVYSTLSLQQYARKRIKRGLSPIADQRVLTIFENELTTLKKLSHRHLVKFVGSYTDQIWVGLLMQPIAERDLADYFNCKMDDNLRRRCLRTFFGCLATALVYLHSRNVMHKDIKPKNVLVKGTTVFLTDFGTARIWEDDTGTTTTGGTAVYTPRYCAPEVADKNPRGRSSDIWSLGCVFLEMASILNGYTIDDMRAFYSQCASGTTNIWSNDEATSEWIEKLRAGNPQSDDVKPLEWVTSMLKEGLRERPTADQVVSAILEVDSENAFFCSHCFGEQSGWTASSLCTDSFSDISSETVMTTSIYESGNLPVFPTGAPVPDSKAMDQPPQEVHDEGIVTTEVLDILDMYQGENSDIDDMELEEYRPHQEIPTSPTQDDVSDSDTVVNEGPSTVLPVREVTAPSKAFRTVQAEPQKNFVQLRDEADVTKLSCQWPRWKSECSKWFNGKDELETHYRDIHLVHDFSWSYLLPPFPPRSDQKSQVDNGAIGRESEKVGERALGKTDSTANRGANEKVDPVVDARADGEANSGRTKRVRFNPQRYAQTLQSYAAQKYTPRVYTPRVYTPQSHGPRSYIPQSYIPQNYPTRFNSLPQDRRPEPSSSASELEEDITDDAIVAPEPLRPPPIREDDCFPLPNSSMAPSYVLAGTNRFTTAELQQVETNPGAMNLFVYGRLMFPSVLRGVAFRSIKGAYSSLHQRRLFPASIDWARVDESLKRAAEAMTPAVLKGYDRWRPSGTECAAIQDCRLTERIQNNRSYYGLDRIYPEPPGEVRGFLILGVTEEALRYCDMLFSSDRRTLKRARPPENSTDTPSRPDPTDQRLQRQVVKVGLHTSDGQFREVNANTYVWAHGVDQLRDPWDPERFVRGASIRGLSEVDGREWTKEEQSLARIIKIRYALAGDNLCSAILAHDVRQLETLLREHYDPNAPCRVYGTPLQAAVCAGDEDMVGILISWGADVNASGGKYETPLIAATIGSRKKITKMLLKAKADVFARGVQHVGALYQAVGHSDWAIAHMLLEHGAWLTEDYGEILDLAAERRDRDVQELLFEYDVRDLHKRRIGYSATGRSASRDRRSISGRSSRSDGQEEQYKQPIKKSASILSAVMKKYIVLQAKSGSWRGLKGVSVIRAALDAGAPLTIIAIVRAAWNPIQNLIDVLREADRREEQERRAIGDENDQLPTEEDDDGGNAHGVRINVTGPDDRPETPPPPPYSPRPKNTQFRDQLLDDLGNRIRGFDLGARSPDRTLSGGPSPSSSPSRGGDGSSSITRPLTLRPPSPRDQGPDPSRHLRPPASGRPRANSAREVRGPQSFSPVLEPRSTNRRLQRYSPDSLPLPDETNSLRRSVSASARLERGQRQTMPSSPRSQGRPSVVFDQRNVDSHRRTSDSRTGAFPTRNLQNINSSFSTCNRCNGHGWYREVSRTSDRKFEVACELCDGSGKLRR